MVSEIFTVPQLQLLDFKETQLNVLPFVREAASLRYKPPQEDNYKMGNRIESIMRTARGSVSFLHVEDTNTTISTPINDSTYLQKPFQAERTIMKSKGYLGGYIKVDPEQKQISL